MIETPTQFMYVYESRQRNLQGELTAISVESNLKWALDYWTQRKSVNPKLFWVIR
jgi:hypothetical protein